MTAGKGRSLLEERVVLGSWKSNHVPSYTGHFIERKISMKSLTAIFDHPHTLSRTSMTMCTTLI
jgi:hypothetical protein